MPSDPVPGWSGAQRRLHWWIAGLVFLGFALGWVMVAVPLRALLLKFLLYQVHKTIGLTVFGLVAVRLAVRLRRGRAAWDAELSAWQRSAATLMHAMLYGLLFVVPVLGYLTAATSPTGVPTLYFGVIPIPHVVPAREDWFEVATQVHRSLAILLVVLACGHGAVAVYHHMRGNEVLRRMWRG